MNYLKYTIYILLVAMCSCASHGIESTKFQSQKKEVEEADKYLKTLEELTKDFFKNYWEIEKLVVDKLEDASAAYFIENDCYDILGKYESTLKVYCQICEDLNVKNQGGLLTSYLHLNDMKNVKKQYERMQNDKNAFIYKDFFKYIDSGKTLESKHIVIRFDKRVGAFAHSVYAHASVVEQFISKEWEGLLPPKTRVMLLYCDGPGPYNSDINETYLPVKSMPISKSKEIAGGIVHETFHLVNVQLLSQQCAFEIDWGMNSFKFLDEGYAQLVESKFMDTYSAKRRTVDDYSIQIMLNTSFDFTELKTKWKELFSNPEIKIYYLAHSFACFLEDKYGADKHKALFLPKSKVLENNWLAYVERYFGATVDDLIEEWKQQLLQ